MEPDIEPDMEPEMESDMEPEMEPDTLSPLARAAALGQGDEVVRLIDDGADIDGLDAHADTTPII
eukprot:6620333-Pyramimonas_sp.AAC.1